MISYVDQAVKDTVAPETPEYVTVADVAENSAVISWEEALDNVGVVGYNVYVNDNKVNEELITDTSYTLEGTDRRYRVCGNSNSSRCGRT